MKVTVISCPKCKDVVFSRTRHDMRSCSCGSVSIDGGDAYCRIAFDPLKISVDDVKTFDINIEQTKKDLYKDWNEMTDKYGIIKSLTE